jgi:murein L,D-transpeptidase YcbB/YkuD
MCKSKALLVATSALMTALLFVAADIPLGHAQTTPAQELSELTLLAPQAVARYYSQHPTASAWGEGEDLSELMQALSGLEQHGLNPMHYHFEQLRSPSVSTAALDVYATDAWLSAAAHMLYGKLDPISVEPNWTAIGRQADLVAALNAALTTHSIAPSLEQFAPQQEGYAALLSEYQSLRALAVIPIRVVPDGPTFRPGMSGDRVKALQERLAQLELLFDATIDGVMGTATTDAVMTFQTLHDLDSDGLVGAATLAALNRGPQEKLAKLRVNMERWRWLPQDLGRKHIRVNIAGFNVAAWKDGALVRTHLAIVGKPYRKTPVFSDEIEYIVFNPWWEVPNSIARVDKLPLFQQDPSLVDSLGFQVLDRDGQVLNNAGIDWTGIRPGTFPYRLRQSPGPQNALGEVKIMFPNIHNVYLHDTPTRGLFSNRQRAFSSGCMRTQDPLDLAAWLLEETADWDKNRINAAIASGLETRVNLTRRVPVHVLYFTAVNEEHGGVRYLDDIYQRDDAVLAGLRSTTL